MSILVRLDSFSFSQVSYLERGCFITQLILNGNKRGHYLLDNKEYGKRRKGNDFIVELHQSENNFGYWFLFKTVDLPLDIGW